MINYEPQTNKKSFNEFFSHHGSENQHEMWEVHEDLWRSFCDSHAVGLST